MGLPLLLGLVHVALVAPHYFVGSFDDDGGYILAARALLAGHGLTGPMPTALIGRRLVPAWLLGAAGPAAVAVAAHATFRCDWLSVVAYAGIFPLTWLYLGRRRIGDGVRVATLVVLALGPPLATYGSMVMAETPFLVLLLVLLLLVDRWDNQDRVFTGAGVGRDPGLSRPGVVKGSRHRDRGRPVSLAATARCRRRSWRKAVAVGAGAALLLVPVVVARLVAGSPAGRVPILPGAG